MAAAATTTTVTSGSSRSRVALPLPARRSRVAPPPLPADACPCRIVAAMPPLPADAAPPRARRHGPGLAARRVLRRRGPAVARRLRLPGRPLGRGLRTPPRRVPAGWEAPSAEAALGLAAAVLAGREAGLARSGMVASGITKGGEISRNSMLAAAPLRGVRRSSLHRPPMLAAAALLRGLCGPQRRSLPRRAMRRRRPSFPGVVGMGAERRDVESGWGRRKIQRGRR
ncbi:unnamed protein product [Urochloa humidicola]